ncbi:hypothetical protein F2Q68_00022211 [Brassica cretica]|uniref:Uncharacterized protein n=1 Tax=Brassica cretica TaxID=69181 RepID=A0A8S9FTD0_BRACR|nr:hypothetical protein F2Q68_00022211 [Brassica cretica]
MNVRGNIPTKFALGIFRGHFRQTSSPRNFLGSLFPRNSVGKFRGISEERRNSEELFPTTCFVVTEDDLKARDGFRLYLHEEATRARTKCVKAYTRVRLSLKILVKDKEKYAGGIGLNRLLRLVVILRKKGMRQQSSTLVQEAKVATTASRNMCGVSHWLEDVLIGSAEGVVDIFNVSRPEVSRSANKYKAHHKEFRTTKSEPSMMQDNTWKGKTCSPQAQVIELKEVFMKGILRQCPQESLLANGQILIDGQLSKGMISRILDKISQAAREESQGVSWILWYEAQFIQLAVGSKSISGGGVSCLSVQRYKVMLKYSLFKNIKVKSKTVPEIWNMSDLKVCGWFQWVQCDIKVLLQHEGFTRIVSKVCSARCLDGWQVLLEIMAVQKVFKAEVDFDSRLNAHEWNQKAKEEINLQKDVQVSVQALEQNDNGIVTYLSSGVMSMFKEDHEGTSSLAQGGAERSEKR